MPHFIGQAVYIYSFEKDKMLYASGWEELLGYKNEEITLLKIVSLTSERHFNFSNDFNDKALQYLSFFSFLYFLYIVEVLDFVMFN